jgi:SAM-dependent methyltransferase
MIIHSTFILGLIIFGLFIIILLCLLMIVWGSNKAAPWVPFPEQEVIRVIKELSLKETDVVYDLGCGDGRWLWHLANLTPAKNIIGLEISPFFYFYCRIKKYLGKFETVTIKHIDLFKEDLSKADVIISYLMPKALIQLESKLSKKLKKGLIVVSGSFTLNNRQPFKTIINENGRRPVYFYRF